jgi:hypothetical protein
VWDTLVCLLSTWPSCGQKFWIKNRSANRNLIIASFTGPISTQITLVPGRQGAWLARRLSLGKVWEGPITPHRHRPKTIECVTSSEPG